jgi:HSP20 family protein
MDSYFRPFQELQTLRGAIDQLFADAWPGFFGRDSFFLPGQSARGYPLINLSADPENYVVDAFAPGLDVESLDISVQSNNLTISGEKKPTPELPRENFHRKERSAGRFLRSYQLDSEIETERVNAVYKRGILTITLPKSAAAKPKQIPISVS